MPASTVCSIPQCSNTFMSIGRSGYCTEHIGDGAVIDAMENLGDRLEHLADQVKRVARILEDRTDQK